MNTTLVLLFSFSLSSSSRLELRTFPMPVTSSDDDKVWQTNTSMLVNSVWQANTSMLVNSRSLEHLGDLGIAKMMHEFISKRGIEIDAFVVDIVARVGDDDEMIENSMGQDLREGEMIESSVIRVPRVGEDGEVVENPGGTELILYRGDPNLEPYEGMEFESEEATKAFYDAYAQRVGFVTRVSSYCRSKLDGAVISRRLDDAKKIRELSHQLHRANQQCAMYREHLHMVLKDIEEHTYHLSEKVEDIVNSIKELESQEEQQHSHPRHRC
ncbi:hypothetical protein HHK36_022056 [Tetracentron sinense]|uniref:Uncharacterized protein n=1 Tax=Tetracentron sinense TaxID=13715 RepID=A0A834YTS9_TETSI|nr:hypothetical protein HHK36_022056 [Tetracentron sinense]